MIKLKEHKHETELKAIERMPLPSRVYIPLSQHIGKACVPLVKAGDYVFNGERIANIDAHVYAPIHASLSGKVESIQNWPHPVLGRCKAVVIESDGLDKSKAQDSRPQEVIENLAPEEIRKIVFEAGIVGMGGAAFPTHIKLSPPKPIDVLIINGAECEPYLTGDYRLMIEKTEEIILGIGLLTKCLGIKHVYVAIEDNKPEAIKKLMVHSSKFIVKVLKSAYPQGGEKQLIKNILNKEVPRGKLPLDVGVIVHNVATVYAIYEAVYMNRPLTERVVTVSGSCVSYPKNLLARIGTPIKELIDFCGPLNEEPFKIIVGGPMMGIAQFSVETPVIKSSTAVLLLSKKEAVPNEESPCIRCGACIKECPVNLMPCMINLSSEKGMWPVAKTYGASDCIECGVCSYVCPANIKLVHSIKRAKLEAIK